MIHSPVAPRFGSVVYRGVALVVLHIHGGCKPLHSTRVVLRVSSQKRSNPPNKTIVAVEGGNVEKGPALGVS